MVSVGSFRVQPLKTALSELIPTRVREYRVSVTFYICAFTLVMALLLGGGTRGGFLSDAILELISIPSLLIALWSLIDLTMRRTRTRADAYRVFSLCTAIVLLPLVQLVPLPPWIWTHLPGREPIAQVFGLLGDQTPWLPISVSPHATWLSVLSMLPPIAIFLATIQLDYQERRGLSVIIIGIGVVSVFVGLAQVAQGPTSLLRFFTITNVTEAVGFFANRNHFAAFLYVVLLFAAVWAIDFGFKIGSWKELRSVQTATVMALMATLTVFIIVVLGEAMARSRAGLGLTIVALMAVFALTLTDRRNVSEAKQTRFGHRVSKILVATTILAVILSVQFAVYRILDRFGTDPLEDARIVFAHNTVTAAEAFMPFGSGSGTFVPVYQLFEKPADALPNIYANHAHDDFLELWLETGVLGAALFCLFVVWFGLTTVKLWRRPAPEMSAFDCNLARAATVVVGLLLAHSFVDYPMRTEAIMAVFAVCSGFMIAPLKDGEEGKRFATSLERYLVRQKAAPKVRAVSPIQAPEPAAAPLPENGEGLRPQSAGRWGKEIEWPQEWRGSGEQNAQNNPKSDTNSTSKVDPER